jgi:hypothetical protein
VKRSGHSAVTVNNKVYIAGGYGPALPFWGTTKYVSDTIDIYDNITNTWATSHIGEPKAELAGIAVGNNIYWAGGHNGYYSNASCLVEIHDVNTGNSSHEKLSAPAFWTNHYGQNAVERNGQIVFIKNHYTGSSDFDIYDIASNTWSIGLLPLTISGSSIITVNNEIYIAGMEIENDSSKVYKLQFNSVLPFNFLNLSAEVVQNDIKIKWQTANETNTKYHIVQRSANGSNFRDIGAVKSTNTTGTNSYTFTDHHPLGATNYYRLKIEHSDGRFTYSNIMSIKLSTLNNAITVHPNPAKNEIFILFNSATTDKYRLNITDITGRLVKYTEGFYAIGANSISIDLIGFAPGVYSINFNNRKEKQSVSFYKE